MSRRQQILLSVGAICLVIVAYGGYSDRWPWTGINEHTASLWEWLNLLLLPVVVALLPIWLRRGTQLRTEQKAMALASLGVFSLVVLLGYLVPWAWTGFVGNTLWNWLNLLALPVAIALIPVIGVLKASWDERHWRFLVAGFLIFLIPLLGGYLGDWRWTGFPGNTLWDWMHLLLLPLLIPIVVVPAITALASQDVSAHRAGETAAAEPHPAHDSTEADLGHTEA
ncbi:MAG: hypothetical protein JOY58_05365 [Solirubrobacterales bacterium]|nr:hypothetical protein [Solirubrobacterales bacterium]